MSKWRSFYPHGLTLICFLVFVVFGSAMAKNIGNDSDTDIWLSYSNDENKFTFKYPREWEVIDEGFYKTAYALTIKKTGGDEDSDNWIRINSPQFQAEDGKCIECNNQFICTYSKDANVIAIFKRVAASFRRK